MGQNTLSDREMLPQLDAFIDMAIVQKRPIPVSALREEIVCNYPKWALREILMNAIMHRDYNGNAPIKFYQYPDRIEIINHGGLYGKARPENFPTVNDYRNLGSCRRYADTRLCQYA